MKYYVGIDIGGTAIKYGVIEENGTIVRRGERETEAEQGGAAILQKAIEIVGEMKREVQSMDQEAGEAAGICISTAGMVDIEKGEIFYSSPLIPNYTGINFKEAMKREFGLLCEVENDVNCAGLAEYQSGSAKGSRISLMLTVGTGIGGSMIIDGEVFRGASGSACEIGYMKMGGSDFQTLGSAQTLVRKVAEWKKEPEKAWNGRRIFEEARRGDVLCARAIDELAEVLGQGIANLCYMMNPEVVVLGGGIMAQEEFLKTRIADAVNKYLVSSIAEHTRLAFAKHGNDAGMLGAFYHYCNMQKKKSG